MLGELVKKQEGSLGELDMQLTISTAKTYPRKISDFIKLCMELATQDKETAQACYYCLPATDKRPVTEGPSVRLAEIVAYAWGNIQTAKRILKNDGSFITAQGIAWDLERNQGAKVDVQRSIINSYGKRYFYELQANTANAAASIAFRNAVFTVIPKVFIDPIWKQAKKIAVGSKKDMGRNIKKIIDRFSQWNIEPKQILTFFKKNSVEELTQVDLQRLMGIGTSIKEDHVLAEEAFVIKEEEITTEIINDVECMKNLFK